jgi:hypothetical protein
LSWLGPQISAFGLTVAHLSDRQVGWPAVLSEHLARVREAHLEVAGRSFLQRRGYDGGVLVVVVVHGCGGFRGVGTGDATDVLHESVLEGDRRGEKKGVEGRKRALSLRSVSNSPGKPSTPLMVNSFVQRTLRRKGLLPPALPECLGRRGYLHDQTTLTVPDGNEVVVLVEGLCLVVYGINDDDPAAADFRRGDGFA